VQLTRTPFGANLSIGDFSIMWIHKRYTVREGLRSLQASFLAGPHFMAANCTGKKAGRWAMGESQ